MVGWIYENMGNAHAMTVMDCVINYMQSKAHFAHSSTASNLKIEATPS